MIHSYLVRYILKQNNYNQKSYFRGILGNITNRISKLPLDQQGLRTSRTGNQYTVGIEMVQQARALMNDAGKYELYNILILKKLCKCILFYLSTPLVSYHDNSHVDAILFFSYMNSKLNYSS